MLNWGAVRTHPSEESRASENLRRQNYIVFNPLFLERALIRGRAAMREAQLFPAYIMVALDADWHSMRSTRGVADVLMDGERPATVRPSEFKALSALVGEDGYVVLPPRFGRGDDINVRGGIWKGATGLYEGQSGAERAYCLLNIMGRAVRAEVDRAHLVAA